MDAQFERLEVYTGYKFYHEDYNNHSNHVLQLFTEFYFELENFRELWAGKESADIFIEDILSNMKSIQRQFENDPLIDGTTSKVGASSAAGSKGKHRAVGRRDGKDITGRSMDAIPEALNGERTPPLENTRRRHSPASLRPNIHEIPPKNPNKPLTIKLPPAKRSESLEDGASFPPRATFPVDVLPVLEKPMQHRGLGTAQMLNAGGDPHSGAAASETGKYWAHQKSRREYTVRGQLSVVIPRSETSPRRSPVLSSRYSLRPRRSHPGSGPRGGAPNNPTGHKGRRIKREGAFILDHETPALSSHPGGRRDLPATEIGLNTDRVGTRLEGDSTSATRVQNTCANTNGKRHLDENAKQPKEGGSRPQKQPRRR